MNKRVDRVELGLENLQVISFEYKDIIYLTLGKIEHFYSKYEGYDEYLNEDKVAKIFAIQIKPEANTMDCHDINFKDSKELPFKRLTSWNDICNVAFKYSDGTEETFMLQWYGEDEESNSAQSSHIDEQGYLYILCKKKENVKEYFLLD